VHVVTLLCGGCYSLGTCSFVIAPLRTCCCSFLCLLLFLFALAIAPFHTCCYSFPHLLLFLFIFASVPCVVFLCNNLYMTCSLKSFLFLFCVFILFYKCF
jgi:hypothetical protein